MAQLIAQSDWTNYVELSTAIESSKYTSRIVPKVLEAQDFDLRDLIGKELYNEVISVSDGNTEPNLSSGNYTALLPYLKPVIVYFTYARYLPESQNVNSRHGTVKKLTPHSEPIELKELMRLAAMYKSRAIEHGERLIEFLEDNVENYPTWNSNRTGNESRNSGRVWSM